MITFSYVFYLNSNIDCVILMWLEKTTCFSLLSHVVILFATDD